MKLDRDKIKSRISDATNKAFSDRGTINTVLARGLNEMVDAIVDEIELNTELKQKKVA